MTPERNQRVMALFEAACERSVEGRAAFLDEACAGDQALRSEVEELLAEGRAPTITGTQIGPYRIEAKLGEGGMGVVFRAVDTKLNRPVAVKFLAYDLADAAARRRFQGEAANGIVAESPAHRDGLRRGRVRGPAISGYRIR